MSYLKKLPIGIQSFERIIKNNYLYVDKTEYIYRLIIGGEPYFLSHPRRFGKSLLVSTLRSIFEGKKDLFKKLWIYNHGDWEWKEHPVISLDFNGIPHSSPDELKRGLIFTLEEYAEQNGFTLTSPFLVTKFRELVLKLKKKTGRDVVVLVDEYDKPIIEHIGKDKEALQTAKANRDLLRHFYGVIKGAEVADVLKFVFITGISKFSKVSIFSELNNLEDLTMDKDYSCLLGYTEEELLNYFDDHIKEAATKNNLDYEEIIKKIRIWYNGYKFSNGNVKVYNPLSVMTFLKKKEFKNYWFETGTPTFLISLLKEKKTNIPAIENLKTSESAFSSYEIEDLAIEPLLFQTGYITIKEVEDKNTYILNYPNQEVRVSFLELLFNSFSGIENVSERSKYLKLSKCLEKNKFQDFFEIVKSLYADIPYTLMLKADESYFHSLFYLMVCASGVDSVSEVLTSKGRIDLTIEFNDKLFIIEFKCNQSAETGIKQIKEKRYYEKYLQNEKKIYLIGVNFDTAERNISGWKVEVL